MADTAQVDEAKRTWRRLIEEAAEGLIKMWPYRMDCNKSRAVSGIDVSIQKSWENHTERIYVYWLDVELALSQLTWQEKQIVEKVYWAGIPPWLVAQTLGVSKYKARAMCGHILWHVAIVTGIASKTVW